MTLTRLQASGPHHFPTMRSALDALEDFAPRNIDNNYRYVIRYDRKAVIVRVMYDNKTVAGWLAR